MKCPEREAVAMPIASRAIGVRRAIQIAALVLSLLGSRHTDARVGTLTATPVTEPTTFGPNDAYIDWSDRELYAWGSGQAPREVPLLVEALPFAEQAALEAARASLRKLVAQTRWLPHRLAVQLQARAPLATEAPPRGTLRQLLGRLLGSGGDERHNQQVQRDARLLAALASALELGRAAQTSYADDGTVQVQLRVPLDGGRGGLGEIWTQLRPDGGAGRESPPRRSARGGTLPSVRPPTGIVVQARGLGVTPTLWPRLVRGEAGCRDGLALYDQAHLSDEMLRSYGVAPFVRSIESALRAPRVADRAMLVRAGGRCPHAPATLWLEEADADAIETEQELLREGRVVIVVD